MIQYEYCNEYWNNFNCVNWQFELFGPCILEATLEFFGVSLSEMPFSAIYFR